ncbi:MAG: hypothetical protein Q4F88_05285, partial [Eubacteriales bacterium]|nr:hypothetical protein [Eubacteriales bacterium]
MNNYYLKKFLSILKYSIIFYFLFIFAKYVNRDIHIDALYMDDLFSWSYFGEGETFLEYSFPTSGHTYRPVYWMIQYLEFFFVKDNINLFLYINLLLNSFISLIIYHIVYKISKSNISGIISSLLYISSYFSYYQIAQVIGTLESIALLFAILVLYNLILFIKKEEKYINNFLISNFFFLLVIFTHERYIGLIIPIILAFLLKIYLIKIKKKEYLSLILPIFSIILFVYIRTIILGNFIPRGTGSKEVTTTFDLMNCLHFAIDQVKYIFAFNPGEAYLSAINFNDLNYDIKVLIYKSLIPILISIILYIILKTFFIIKNNNKNIFKYILK